MQIISPSSESHQQVVAVGQPLTAQPQGTVVVSKRARTWVHTHTHTSTQNYEQAVVTLTFNKLILPETKRTDIQ